MEVVALGYRAQLENEVHVGVTCDSRCNFAKNTHYTQSQQPMFDVIASRIAGVLRLLLSDTSHTNGIEALSMLLCKTLAITST